METQQQSLLGTGERKKRKLLKAKQAKLEKRTKRKIKMINSTKRAEEDAEAHVKKAALYLKTWSKDRSNWKFEKLRQIWLIKHMFDFEKVKSKYFRTFVDYIAKSQGKARQEVLEKALKIVESRNQWTELKEQGLSDEEILSRNSDLKRVSDLVYSRARLIVQAIPEETV